MPPAQAPLDANERAADILGGASVLDRSPRNSIDVHRMLAKGLPVKALHNLRRRLKRLDTDEVVARVVGVTPRTLQRWKHDPEAVMSVDQSGRAWTFADILARAEIVFGGQEEAEAWMVVPAMALDGIAPIDMVQTPAGAATVIRLLGALEYGVYI